LKSIKEVPMQRACEILLIVLAASIGSGCASFREQTTEPPLWPPATPALRQSIRLVLKHETTINGTRRNPDVLAVWNNRVLDAYRQSGLFSNVDWLGDVPTADLTGEILIRYRSETSVLQSIAWGLTLMLYPMQGKEEISVHTVIKDRRGTTLATIEKREELTTWFELLLLFAMPMNAPGATTSRVLYDLQRATLAELDQGPLRRMARAQNRFL
jgi:hypothetical protein